MLPVRTGRDLARVHQRVESVDNHLCTSKSQHSSRTLPLPPAGCGIGDRRQGEETGPKHREGTYGRNRGSVERMGLRGHWRSPVVHKKIKAWESGSPACCRQLPPHHDRQNLSKCRVLGYFLHIGNILKEHTSLRVVANSRFHGCHSSSSNPCRATRLVVSGRI